MNRPAEISDGLVNSDRILSAFLRAEAVVILLQSAHSKVWQDVRLYRPIGELAQVTLPPYGLPIHLSYPL